MNILIRCDMGGGHGMGHAVRMKALADALTTMGATVSFTSDTPRVLETFVEPYECGDAFTITHFDLDVLVVDTKTPIQESWYGSIAGALGCQMVRIDHPQATPESCALLIGPCAHWEAATVQRLQTAFRERLLYGWDYVMLPQEVTEQAPLARRASKRSGITFCAGGSDPTNALDTMLKWGMALSMNVPLRFVRPGSQGRYRHALRHACFVVGMFGQTAYECLWYQTPMLMFAHTEENIHGARALETQARGQVVAGGSLGIYDADTFGDIVKAVYQAAMRTDTEVPSLMDGLGVQRVAEAILSLEG